MGQAKQDTVKRFYRDLLAHGRYQYAEELLAPSFIDHGTASAEPGRDVFEAWLRRFDNAFRDRVFVLEDVTVEEDYVSVRWIGSLVHAAEFMGYEPSGEAVELSGVDVFRLSDGRIAERWNHEVGLGLVEQLELRERRVATRLRLQRAGAASVSVSSGRRDFSFAGARS
jgi:predicted SnoaL-like aldol condensation-catalyzing enzyme